MRKSATCSWGSCLSQYLYMLKPKNYCSWHFYIFFPRERKRRKRREWEGQRRCVHCHRCAQLAAKVAQCQEHPLLTTTNISSTRNRRFSLLPIFVSTAKKKPNNINICIYLSAYLKMAVGAKPWDFFCQSPWKTLYFG